VGQATSTPSSAGVVMTSSNGLTWSDETSIPQGRWSCVTYGSDKFVALGVDGSVMTSSNGESWVLGTQPIDSLIFRDVIYVPSIKEFMGLSGSPVASSSITSKDGLNWIADADSATLLWNKVVYNPRESMYVAVSLNGAFSQIMTKRYGVSIATKTTIPYLTTSNLQSNFGSLTAPSYTFTGDLDTGIYRPSTNSMGLVCNGVSSLNITPTGFNSSVQPAFYAAPVATLGSSSADEADTLVPGAFWATPLLNRGFTSWTGGILTIATTGIYQVSLSMTYGSGVGARIARVNISTGEFVAYTAVEAVSNTGLSTNVSGTSVIQLASGVTLRALVRQDSGDVLGYGHVDRNAFSVVRLY